VRFRAFLILPALAIGALAQVPDTSAGEPAPIAPNPLITLASEFFEHDYVNVFAYTDGSIDFNTPVLTTNGVRNGRAEAYDIGGGINLFHAFRDSALTFNYSGGYHGYANGGLSSGSNQNLGLSFSKRLNRRISMNIGLGGGQYVYGSTIIASTTTTDTPVISNPFSPQTRYASAVIGFNFIQTRRLSYSVYGSYFLSRYNFPGSIGATGVSGGASANYRVNAKTSVSGVYSHSYYTYQRNVGNASADQFGGSIFHQFNGHWSASVFAGVGRSNSSGTVLVPVTLIVGNTAVGGYALGRYQQTATFPAVNGTVSRVFRRSIFSVSAGEGLAGAGNGYFLDSKTLYISGVYSFSVFHQNLSAGGAFNHLSSIANKVSSSYDSASFSLNYGRILYRQFGTFFRYDFIHYGALVPLNGTSDNRLTFGLNWSSRSVPITLF
jgi:hypothetical protein